MVKMFQNVVVIIDVCSILVFGFFVAGCDCFIGVIRFIRGAVVIILRVRRTSYPAVFVSSGISF